MFYVYKMTNVVTGKFYIGYTNNPKSRIATHKHAASSGKKSKLYDNIRKYGFGSFNFEIVFQSTVRQVALDKEVEMINLDDKLSLNLALGGEGGYVVPDEKKEEWRAKLSAARKGKKPALGLKHTDATKAMSSIAGKKRWDIYGRYPDNVVDFSFKEATANFGISKTHYYRLKKQVKE